MGVLSLQGSSRASWAPVGKSLGLDPSAAYHDIIEKSAAIAMNVSFEVL